jgi:hypothetical protein
MEVRSEASPEAKTGAVFTMRLPAVFSRSMEARRRVADGRLV